MDFSSLLPLLKILTSADGQKIFFFLVVGLTAVVAVIRAFLRKDLENLISQARILVSERDVTLKHPIIQEAEKRVKAYKNGSDKVNTSVIIDQIYSSNKFGIASRDSWDFVCRSFPNVLISLGLLGTFVGITSNLSSIQEILKSSGGTTEQIITKLQEPLNGMATAFGSSLIALLCGIALTIVNLVFNTTVAKYRFLSLLEDYLNSEVSTTPTGVFLAQIEASLTSFRQESIGIFTKSLEKAIGNSFTTQISQIITENRVLRDNLNDLVSNFKDSATKISESSQAFQYAASVLSGSELPNSIHRFSSTIEQVTATFEETSNSVESSSIQFQEAAQKLDDYSGKSLKLYDAFRDLIRITQSNEENLLEAIPAIKAEREILISTVELIKDLQSNIELSAQSLSAKSDESILAKAELVRLTKSINAVTQKITEKLYQGLDFNSLHDDNQTIIQLLQEIISCVDISNSNYSDTTNNLDNNPKIDQLILAANEISSQLINANVIMNEDNAQMNQSLASIKSDFQQALEFLLLQNQSLKEGSVSENESPLLKIEDISEIKFQIYSLSKVIENINEQISIIFQNNRQQNSQSELFPTTKKAVSNIKNILSKRIIN